MDEGTKIRIENYGFGKLKSFPENSISIESLFLSKDDIHKSLNIESDSIESLFSDTIEAEKDERIQPKQIDAFQFASNQDSNRIDLQSLGIDRNNLWENADNPGWDKLEQSIKYLALGFAIFALGYFGIKLCSNMFLDQQIKSLPVQEVSTHSEIIYKKKHTYSMDGIAGGYRSYVESNSADQQINPENSKDGNDKMGDGIACSYGGYEVNKSKVKHKNQQIHRNKEKWWTNVTNKYLPLIIARDNIDMDYVQDKINDKSIDSFSYTSKLRLGEKKDRITNSNKKPEDVNEDVHVDF